jgi:hypothetical protein
VIESTIETVGALAVDRGLKCGSARVTDVRGRRTRTQAPGVDPAGIDPAAVKMRRRVGGEMPATHTRGATAEMGSATTHTHGATTKMGAAATAKVRAATATKTTAAAAAEVTPAATSAANMSTTTAAPNPAETAASCVSSRRQTKRYGYCGQACRDFPHDTPRQGQMRQANARSPGPFRRDAAMHTGARRAYLNMCAIHQPRQSLAA